MVDFIGKSGREERRKRARGFFLKRTSGGNLELSVSIRKSTLRAGLYLFLFF